MNLVRVALAALLLASATWAQALVFAVNEGVTYRVGNDEIRARYATMASDIGKLLGQPVSIEPVGDYKQLRQGLADKRYDLALVHPAHISITALKNGYHLVAVTKGYTAYKASFLVRKDAPYKTLADLRGLKIGVPDEDSITAWLVRATMREALGGKDGGKGADKDGDKAVTYNYTRYQDAVPFMVQNTFTQAGATASSVLIKQWESEGGRVMATSPGVPIKHVIAGPALAPEQLAQVREYLLGLDGTEAGRKKLEAAKVQGYTAFDEAALVKLGAWLGL